MKRNSESSSRLRLKLLMKDGQEKTLEISREERRRHRLLDLLLSLFLSLIFGLAWAAMMLNNVGVAQQPLKAVLTQMLTLLLLALLLTFRKSASLIFASILGICLLSWLMKGTFLPALPGLLERFFDALKNSILWSFASTRGSLEQPACYAILVNMLAAALALPLIWLKPLPFLLATVMLFPFFGADASNPFGPEQMLCLCLCLFVLGIVFSRHGKLTFGERNGFSIPPFLLVALLLAASLGLQAIFPQNFLRNAPIADDIRQIQKRLGAPETVNYYEFSLRDAGYYPLNKSLGGPLQLQHHLFMYVSGPEQNLLLRGAMARDYDGHVWHGDNMEPNFIFDNEARHGKQGEVFSYPEVLRSGHKWIDRLFVHAKLRITPRQLPIQVVFNGGRPENITTESGSRPGEKETLYYFNDGGQIYASQEIGEAAYEVDGYIPKAISEEEKGQILREALREDRIQLAEVKGQEEYRSLLEETDPDLAEIVYAKASDPAARLETFLNIRRYLSEHYTYATDVSIPDPNRDFLDSFLREKQGYCVYFATALTLLAREAGIDARYVEGFLVPGVNPAFYDDKDYQREVLSDNAHAWTEVRFDGLGWIPFDATPVADLERMGNDAKEEEKRQPHETTHRTEPTTSLTKPDKTRATTLQQKQSERPPSQNPKPSQPLKQPPNRPPMSAKSKALLSALLLLLLFILLLSIWIMVCKKRSERRHKRSYLLASGKYEPRELAGCIWEDMKTMAELTGLSFTAQQTLLQRFKALEEQIEAPSVLSRRALAAMEKIFYAEENPSLEEISAILDYYDWQEENLKQYLGKRQWILRRVLFPASSAKL